MELATRPAATNDKVQLRVMATLAFTVFYSNYMVAPLLPAFAKEFAVPASQLGWLIAGYLIPYGISTLMYGVLSDWWGRVRTLVALLCFATMTMLLVSCAESWRALLIARILSGVGCGGIVTISLAIVGDRYPYAVQGCPMGRMFGGIAAGIGFGSTLGPMLNPLVGWRNEFRLLACVWPWRDSCFQGCSSGNQRSNKAGFLASSATRVHHRPKDSARWPNHYVHLLQWSFSRGNIRLAGSFADTPVSSARCWHRFGPRRIWPTRYLFRDDDREMGRSLREALRRPVWIPLGGRMRLPVTSS